MARTIARTCAMDADVDANGVANGMDMESHRMDARTRDEAWTTVGL